MCFIHQVDLEDCGATHLITDCTDAKQGHTNVSLSPEIPASMDPGSVRCVTFSFQGFARFNFACMVKKG